MAVTIHIPDHLADRIQAAAVESPPHPVLAEIDALIHDAHNRTTTRCSTCGHATAHYPTCSATTPGSSGRYCSACHANDHPTGACGIW